MKYQESDKKVFLDNRGLLDDGVEKGSLNIHRDLESRLTSGTIQFTKIIYIKGEAVIDVSDEAREASLPGRVAISGPVWATCVLGSNYVEGTNATERMNGILWVMRQAIAGGNFTQEFNFEVPARPSLTAGRSSSVTLKALLKSSDEGEPYLIISRPS